MHQIKLAQFEQFKLQQASLNAKPCLGGELLQKRQLMQSDNNQGPTANFSLSQFNKLLKSQGEKQPASNMNFKQPPRGLAQSTSRSTHRL